MRACALLLTALLLSGCSERERSNPLDPLNPDTRGAPTGFKAVTNRDTARLSWDPMDVSGLEGYTLERSVAGGSMDPLASVSPEVTRYLDSQLTFDTPYSYTVLAVTQYGESQPAKRDTVVPGPHNFWVADFSRGMVRRVTYDGGHVLAERHFFISPEALAYQAGEGQLWVADYFERAVYRLDLELQDVVRLTLSGRPIELAIDTAAQALYILETDPDDIVVVSLEGNRLETVAVPFEVDIDGALAFDAVSNSLWLSPGEQGGLYRRELAPGGAWVLASAGPPGRRVDIDPVSGGCWMATDSGIVRLDAAGNRDAILPELQVWDVSVNPVSGDCYFVGQSRVNGRWQAGRIFGWPNAQAEVVVDGIYETLVRIQALPGPGATGFLVEQQSAGRTLRFDSAGNLMGRLDGYAFPLEFALE